MAQSDATSGSPDPAADPSDLLVEAGRVLASSLDYEATIQDAVRLFIPRLADWCAIYLVDAHQEVRIATIAHTQDLSGERARAALSDYSSMEALPQAPLQVIRTGQPDLTAHVEDRMLVEMAQDEKHLEILRSAGIRSAMTVPLVARERILGAISFISAESGRTYVQHDMALAEELGRRAAVAIDNAQLYEQARGAIRLRDEVLGIVAHDLRNPVSTIRMTAEFLMEEELSEEQRRKQSALIVRSADRMNRLIEDLLDVASIEAGRLSIEPSPVQVGPLMEEVHQMFGADTPAARHQFRLEVPPAVPPIQADRSRVLQVLANLVGNAVKFTPAGGTITVRVEPGADRVAFEVADTGPGIAAAELPHVFDRFWQSRGNRRGGAGLGLAITRGIVEAHGGGIEARSTHGEGATFRFTIPVAGRHPAG